MRHVKIVSLIMVSAIIAGIFCSCADSTSVHELKAEGGFWEAGFACKELIPDIENSGPYYVAGYRTGNKAEGVLDNPCVKAVYAGTGGSSLVFITVDCVGLFAEDINKIEKSLASFSEEINCSLHVISTHSHAGADTMGLWGPLLSDGKNSGYMEMLIINADKAAREAYDNRKKGTFWFGYSEKGIENLQKDSRLPQVYDRKLYQMRFEPDDMSDGIRIINYASHAESLGSDNSKISADFPFYLSRKIKKETGDSTVFIPGAVGGLIATKKLKDESGMELEPEENVVMTGELLADAALSISDEKKIAPNFSDVSKTIKIPLENGVFIGASAFDVIPKRAFKTGKGRFGLSIETKVSLIMLGDVQIACIPGEIFPELVIENEEFNGADPDAEDPENLQNILGGSCLVFGLCDDEIGYIIPPSDFCLNENHPYIDKGTDQYGRNHYEETNSLGPDTAEYIAEAIRDLKYHI